MSGINDHNAQDVVTTWVGADGRTITRRNSTHIGTSAEPDGECVLVARITLGEDQPSVGRPSDNPSGVAIYGDASVAQRGVGVIGCGAFGVRGTSSTEGFGGPGVGVDGDGTVGVRGTGRATGVVGVGRVGVHGDGTEVGITAEVSCTGSGQIRLEPMVRAPKTLKIGSLTVRDPNQSATLPSRAKAGTLLAMIGPSADDHARLWFCVRSGSGPSGLDSEVSALWAPVMLGDAIEGHL